MTRQGYSAVLAQGVRDAFCGYHWAATGRDALSTRSGHIWLRAEACTTAK